METCESCLRYELASLIFKCLSDNGVHSKDCPCFRSVPISGMKIIIWLFLNIKAINQFTNETESSQLM